MYRKSAKTRQRWRMRSMCRCSHFDDVTPSIDVLPSIDLSIRSDRCVPYLNVWHLLFSHNTRYIDQRTLGDRSLISFTFMNAQLLLHVDRVGSQFIEQHRPMHARDNSINRATNVHGIQNECRYIPETRNDLYPSCCASLAVSDCLHRQWRVKIASKLRWRCLL